MKHSATISSTKLTSEPATKAATRTRVGWNDLDRTRCPWGYGSQAATLGAVRGRGHLAEKSASGWLSPKTTAKMAAAKRHGDAYRNCSRRDVYPNKPRFYIVFSGIVIVRPCVSVSSTVCFQHILQPIVHAAGRTGVRGLCTTGYRRIQCSALLWWCST